MVSVGIVGGTGYVAGELLRLLNQHPEVNIDFAVSDSSAGKPVNSSHQDLWELSDLKFSKKANASVDLIFLCLPHGKTPPYLNDNRFSDHTKIIDLSNDFRLIDNRDFFEDQPFIYGLPEINEEQISTAKYVANPGCFATAMQLALLPLAGAGELNDEVHVHAITGSTGAGARLTGNSHFSWRDNNLSIYKAFEHQHLAEIKENLSQKQKVFGDKISFLPLRGPFSRGIFMSAYMRSDLNINDLCEIYEDFCDTAAFTHLSNINVHLKQVVNTNNCLLQVQKIDDKILITSVIDNLLKGAAGQAVQNMNIMFDLGETTALQLKANYF